MPSVAEGRRAGAGGVTAKPALRQSVPVAQEKVSEQDLKGLDAWREKRQEKLAESMFLAMRLSTKNSTWRAINIPENNQRGKIICLGVRND